MAYIKGQTVKVTVGEQLIGGQQNCSLNRESETIDSTTKDSGMWSEEEVVGLSWSVDCDGLVVTSDAGLKALKTAWKAGKTVDIKIGDSSSTESGKALIESLSENYPTKENTTYSVTFKGVGELSDPSPAAASLKSK